MAKEVEYGQLTASADLSGSQYRFVKLHTVAWQVAGATTGCSPIAFGALQNDPKSGDEAAVVTFGPTKVEAGGAAGIRDFVGINGSGQAIKVDGAGTCPVYGQFLQAPTAQGQTVWIYLFGGVYSGSATAEFLDNTP